MFILNILPEWMIHTIFMLGLSGVIAGFVLGFIPFISKYSLPIKIISILVLSFGLYLEGGLAKHKESLLKIKEAEIKVAKLEKQASDLNTEMQSIIIERNELLNKKSETIIKYIDRFRDREVLRTVEGPERVRIEEIIKYVENCPIPVEFIDIHNKAATLNKDN